MKHQKPRGDIRTAEKKAGTYKMGKQERTRWENSFRSVLPY